MARKTASAAALKAGAPMSADDALFHAALTNAKSDDVLRAAFIAAGGDQKKPKQILMSARVAHSLKCTREHALIVMGKKGRGKHADTEQLGDDVRTVEEEKACGAARTFLSGRLKAWGLKTSEGRGGDRKGDDKPMTKEKVTSPRWNVTDNVELYAWAKSHANEGYSFLLVNKDHPAVADDDISARIMGAFADHLDNIKAIIADASK